MFELGFDPRCLQYGIVKRRREVGVDERIGGLDCKRLVGLQGGENTYIRRESTVGIFPTERRDMSVAARIFGDGAVAKDLPEIVLA